MSFAIAFNITGDRLLRKGALCLMAHPPSGMMQRFRVVGLSKGGRRIEKWVKLKHCTNFRLKRSLDKRAFHFHDREKAEEYIKELKKASE